LPWLAGGIGFRLAQQFASRGCHVFASARRLAAMQELKGVAGVELLPLDLNSSASIRDAVAQVVGRAGRIDILVRPQHTTLCL
jgi:NAD(P)-dependent dehydrogenase (short-subunit alcohol dehydrogenase family)